MTQFTQSTRSTPSPLPAHTVSAHQPHHLLAGKTLLWVVFEFPSLGTAGYHTYNRSVLAALLAQGARVHLRVLTSRYKALRHPLHDIAGATVSAPGLWVCHGQGWVWGPHAWLRLLVSGVRARLSRDDGPAQMGQFCTPAEATAVQATARALRPDLILLDTLFCASLAGQMAATATGTRSHCPSVVVAHDVFSQRTRELLRVGLQPRPLVDEAMEREALGRADGVIAISEADADALRQLLNGPPPSEDTSAPTSELPHPRHIPVHTLAPDLALEATPPVPHTARRFSPPPNPQSRSAAPHRLFYMGSAAHHNVHAMHWFLHQVWPLLRLRQPHIELVLAGDVGSPWAHHPAPGVQVLGRVNDPAQAAQGCTLAIEPVQAGSGVKIKMLSYFALGLPCVTTPAGAQGLEAYAAALHVADGPQAFCDEVLAVLASLDTAAPVAWQQIVQAGAAAQRQAAQQALAQWLLPLMAPPSGAAHAP